MTGMARLEIWVLAASALLAACGGDKPPAPAEPVPEGPVASPEPAKPAEPTKAAPLRVAYSDWPGWTAFEVGIQKGWFKEAGIEVEFSWFDYLPSMEAFGAGRVDAVMMTNGDALVTGATGGKSKMILVTDYSNGNDKVIAKPGIKSLKDLKGKKIGLELTLVEHLLLLQGLQKVGLKQGDLTLVNFKTNETPQALTSGQVDAVAAWYPTSSQALTAMAGSKAIWTSADVPGLIYDTVAVSPASLSARKDDWAKFVKVWYRISDYVRDPKTQTDAVAIMAAKVGVKAEEYAAAMPGTKLLSLEEAKKVFAKGDGLDSLYGSTKTADDFNVANKVYSAAQPV
ncbi:MAG TPA: ABC transporter substrate-binding protein, partial [Polyangiales bacterium]|nr:ABC transporter substrate-binding protein [Polyangiales bacterium]